MHVDGVGAICLVNLAGGLRPAVDVFAKKQLFIFQNLGSELLRAGRVCG